uniref:Cobalt-precorrin-5B C(1)-methyltransferase n=1 Tax=Prevotella sp. GTC17259 TaxID=3236795 RepID=A0AB33J1N9_9BACT
MQRNERKNENQSAVGSILVYGGTTEGRIAVQVLEEAGKNFYYSTRTASQEVTLHHGVRVVGIMTHEQKIAFCHEHDIRLVIDATHPFAEHIHESVARLVDELDIPLIRFDRMSVGRDINICWIDSYVDFVKEIENFKTHSRRLVVLSLCGVSAVKELCALENVVDVHYRILNVETSRQKASEYGVALGHLHDSREELECLLECLHPDIVLIKESGASGGFQQKTEMALRMGCKVYAIRQPDYQTVVDSYHISANRYQRVDGPHGLRRATEKLFPDFFELKSGLTTGTYATAAAIGACRWLLCMDDTLTEKVDVVIPDGESISVPVYYGEDERGKTYCMCIKDSGDDPDVTNGLEIRAYVELDATAKNRQDGIDIRGGVGIGTITLPGFDAPPGSVAINQVPQQMIRHNLRLLSRKPICVTISVPRGEEIAGRTFNPRLGIKGGISIVGVSGIIKPFSKEGFLNSIRKCIHVAKASGCDHVVINSGAKSEQYVKAYYAHLPEQVFVEYGNFIGETIKMAADEGFMKISLGIMLGKAVKLAAGHLDTHSKHSVMDKQFIASMMAEAHCGREVVKALANIKLARELWQILSEAEMRNFVDVVRRHCLLHCEPLAPDCEVELLLIDNEGRVW